MEATVRLSNVKASLLMHVIKSILVPEDVADLVAREYDRAPHTTCRLLCVNDNDHYIVKIDDAKYLLRVYRNGKPWLAEETAYRFELDWLSFLHARQMPVSYPIARSNGDTLGLVHAPEGDRRFALFSFAPGRMVYPMDALQSRRFGEEMARIHLASDHFQTAHTRRHLNAEWLLDRPLALIRSFLDGRRAADMSLLDAIAPSLHEALLALPTSTPVYGVIGGDFHGTNNFFTDDNQLTFFDFDLCGYGWRAYDLATFWWATKLIKDTVMWEAALAGYESVRPLALEERAALPALVKIRHLWLMGSHVLCTNHLGDAWLNDMYWERHLELLKSFDEEATELPQINS
jgi:Ser/Thr protein kinase RdoA (MazF antagonist)